MRIHLVSQRVCVCMVLSILIKHTNACSVCKILRWAVSATHFYTRVQSTKRPRRRSYLWWCASLPLLLLLLLVASLLITHHVVLDLVTRSLPQSGERVHRTSACADALQVYYGFIVKHLGWLALCLVYTIVVEDYCARYFSPYHGIQLHVSLAGRGSHRYTFVEHVIANLCTVL